MIGKENNMMAFISKQPGRRKVIHEVLFNFVSMWISHFQDIESYFEEILDSGIEGVADMPYLNFCLLGPPVAGKSAFVNTVLSEFCQTVKKLAPTGVHDPPTTTTVIKIHFNDMLYIFLYLCR